MFAIVDSVVNMYPGQLKLCVVCINGRMYVCCSECYALFSECDEPPPLTRVTDRCARR